MFHRQSRYYAIEKSSYETPDGRLLPYVKRRFLPPEGSAVPLARHTVARGDRLDNVTARYLGDPIQFFRLADANLALKPEELTDTIEAILVIPLPTEV